MVVNFRQMVHYFMELMSVIHGVMQWNLCAGSTAAILSSSYSISTGTIMNYAMQLANNGKIYISHDLTSTLSVINSPNSLGAAMSFSLGGQSVAPNITKAGLPNFMNYYPNPPNLVFSNTITCSKVNFLPPPQPTFAATCSVVSVPFNTLIWNFGEPTSGASNTSTLSNPQHIYSSLGTFTTSLIVQSACSTDTLYQSITISFLTPLFVVSGPTAICTGENAIFNASGASNYTWTNLSGAVNVSSVSVNPTNTSSTK